MSTKVCCFTIRLKDKKDDHEECPVKAERDALKEQMERLENLTVERVAKAICTKRGHSPYDLEPGDDPYGTNEPLVDAERFGEPYFYVWRMFVPEARTIIQQVLQGGKEKE